MESSASQAVADRHLVRLRELAELGQLAEAEDVLYAMIDQGGKPRATHFTALISACRRAADLARAERWLFRMQALNVHPGVETYSALISVAAEAQNAEEAQRWLAEAQHAGFQPDASCFESTLRALRLCRQTSTVEAWLEDAMAAGFRPSIACCNEVVGTFSDDGNLQKVEEWLATISHGLGLQPDTNTYNEAIAGYISAGDLGNGERLMREMAALGLEPNIRSFMLLIGDGLTHRDPAVVDRWSKELRASGLEVTVAAYTLVIGAWSAAGNADEAEEWFSNMLQEAKANAEALALVVDTLVLSGAMSGLEAAQEWVNQVRSMGVELTPAVYAALASADVLRGDFEQVEARLQQMEADGLQMDEDTLTALLLAYANAEPQQSQLAEQLFKQQMLRGRIKASHKVLEALRAAVGGARCLALRRELQINMAPPPRQIRGKAIPGNEPSAISGGPIRGSARDAWKLPYRAKSLSWE